jgi:hypothetical protein
MELERIKELISNTTNNCKDIMVDWKNVCKSPEEDKKGFDYIPLLKDRSISGIYVKDKNKEYPITDKYFIKEDSDLLDTLQKLDELFNTGITFMIVGCADNPAGIINHNDLNNPAFIHVMWDVFYGLEITLSNELKGKFNEEKLISYMSKNVKEIYTKDMIDNHDIDPIFYIGLSKKIQMHNTLCSGHKLKVTSKYRDRIAHPRSKPKIIYQKSEIPELLTVLNEINTFLI